MRLKCNGSPCWASWICTQNSIKTLINKFPLSAFCDALPLKGWGGKTYLKKIYSHRSRCINIILMGFFFIMKIIDMADLHKIKSKDNCCSYYRSLEVTWWYLSNVNRPLYELTAMLWKCVFVPVSFACFPHISDSVLSFVIPFIFHCSISLFLSLSLSFLLLPCQCD